LAYDLPKYIIVSLICTIIIETIIAFLLRVKNKKDYVNIILVNMITNPIVVVLPYVLYLYLGINYRYISLFILEVLTVLTEGFIYNKTLKYKKFNGYKLSLTLNLCSYFIGIILNQIIYWC